MISAMWVIIYGWLFVGDIFMYDYVFKILIAILMLYVACVWVMIDLCGLVHIVH